MSVIYVQGGGGGGTTVQDATTTVKGIVRLATIQEAQGNYQDIAVTPAGVQQAIAGIVGGMIFKGSYDVALATPALENAEQGDYYVVSNVKVNPTDTNTTYDRFGQEWAVGDHLVIKEDMGGTIDDAKILKVDNTEKVAYLNDLLDVTEALAAQGHVLIHDGVDYKNRALTTADIVGLAQHLYALLDVSLGELSSAVYTTATTSLNLVHSRDYTIDIQGLDESQQPAVPFVKTMVLPSSLNDDHDEIRVVNLGDGELEFQVTGSAVFHVAGNQSTTPISVTTNSEIMLVGEVRTYTEPDPQDPQQTIQVNKVAWELTTSAIPSRQSLVREGSGDWTNGFLTAADIVGVVSQGQLEALQNEVDRTQDSAGLNNDGSMAVFGGNYINGNTTLRQAIVSLDSALKSEETARISADNAEATARASADSNLQSQINAEVTARTNGDNNLQNQIDALATIATTGAAADASVAHTALSYNPASADVEAHIVGLDMQVNALGSNIVTDVNGVAPVNGSVTLGGEHIDSANTPTNYTASADDLDSHLSGVDTKLGQLQTDLNTEVSDRTNGDSNLQTQIDALATIATTGAAADASVAHIALSYNPASADVEAHIVGLDMQVNALGSNIVTDVNGVAPVNGSVTLGGEHIDSANTPTNYTASADDLDSHLSGVDTKLGQLQTDLNTEVTDRTNGDSNLQTQIDALATIATTGAAADASVAHIALSYNPASADVEAHIVGLDMQVNALGSNIVTGVNGVAPVNGSVTLGGEHIDSANTPTNYTASADDLDSHLSGVDTKLGQLQSELDTTQTGAGLAADGTYLANTSANYINTATSLKVADNRLDTAISGVQNELDETQTGAGLNGDGTYTAPTGTKHLGTATSLKNADVLLDTALTTINATNYTGATADTLATHLGGIDTAIGLKAPIDSPTFTTSANAPTPNAGDNSTNVATTAYVQTELSNLTTTAQGTAGTVQMSDGSSGFSASQWEFDTTNGHLLPKANDTYDIGEPENKVRDLYLGSNSLKFADDAATPNVISVGLTNNVHPLGENLVQMTDGVIPVVYRDQADVDQGGNGYADIEDLTNPNMLAKVASTGKYTDLVDAPQSVIASSSFDTTNQIYQLEAGNHHTFFPAAGDTFDLIVPDSVTGTSGGDAIRITNWGNGQLKITTSGSSANTWLQYSQTLSQADTAQGATQPEVIVESRSTVDLYGWSYSSGGTTYDPAWGIYFTPSMEINTKSLTTSGEMLVYDATNDELVAGGLGDLSLTYAPSNYDNTLGSTVTGDKIAEHLEGIDNKFADISLDELTDVDLTTAPTDGKFLKYNGTNWVPDSVPVTAYAESFTASSTATAPSVPSVGTILLYPATGGTGTLTLYTPSSANLGTQLTITNHSTDTTWSVDKGAGAIFVDGANTNPVTLAPSQSLTLTNTAGVLWYASALEEGPLGSLIDVDLTTTAPTNGDFLKFDGTNWVPDVASVTVASLDDIGDVDLTTTAPSSGDTLEWNGTNWIPVAPSGGGTGVALSVTVQEPTGNVTLSAPSTGVVEEAYIYTPSQAITVSLVAASTIAAVAGSGFKYQIKNRSANVLTIDAGTGVTIDGSQTFALSVQESAVTLITDGSNWYII